MSKYNLILSKRLKNLPDAPVLDTPEKIRQSEREMEKTTGPYFEKLKIVELETWAKARYYYLD